MMIAHITCVHTVCICILCVCLLTVNLNKNINSDSYSSRRLLWQDSKISRYSNTASQVNWVSSCKFPIFPTCWLVEWSVTHEGTRSTPNRSSFFLFYVFILYLEIENSRCFRVKVKIFRFKEEFRMMMPLKVSKSSVR